MRPSTLMWFAAVTKRIVGGVAATASVGTSSTPAAAIAETRASGTSGPRRRLAAMGSLLRPDYRIPRRPRDRPGSLASIRGMPVVEGFNLTPVKSTALSHPDEIDLRREGAVGDRRFLFAHTN